MLQFTIYFFCLFIRFFETESHCVAQPDLELMIHLPQTPECCYFSPALSCPAQNLLFKEYLGLWSTFFMQFSARSSIKGKPNG
jgi:hypothetical protein